MNQIVRPSAMSNKIKSQPATEAASLTNKNENAFCELQRYMEASRGMMPHCYLSSYIRI